MLKNKMFATCLGIIISAATIMLPTDVFAKTDNITVDKNENLQLEDGRLELQNKVDKFMETALASDSSLDKEAVSEFSSDFLDVYKLYKEMYVDMPEEELIERATDNVLCKMEMMVYYTEEEEAELDRKCNNNEPDGYESIAIYINEHLNPDYVATVNTTEKNIEILKKSWNELSEDMKIGAALYIEDMGSSNTMMESIDIESKLNNIKFEPFLSKKEKEKENSLKAVAYSEKYWENYNKNYPDWGLDCANFVSQCLYAGKKVMRNVVSNISDPRNWFSYGSKRDDKKVSSSWRGANMFKEHWTYRSYEYKDFEIGKKGELEKLYDYAKPGYPISFLNPDNSAYHTLIITNLRKTGKNKNKDVGVRNHSGRVDDDKKGIRWLSKEAGTIRIRVYKAYDL